MRGKGRLLIACILALTNCAKHKLAPLGTPSPPPATATVPAQPLAAAAKAKSTPAEKQRHPSIGRSAEVNRLLNEPARMALAPAPYPAKPVKSEDQHVDKITVLVDTADGTLRPTSAAMIQNAFAPLAAQFLLVCPDQLRVGTVGDCRFAAKVSLEDLFREQLIGQGVPPAEALATTLLVHADLASPEKKAFDIRAEVANGASSEQTWHVAPLSAGDHKLELKVTLTARVASAGEVSGAPIVLVRSVSVTGENFFNQYWPAMIGCAAILGLFGWIALTFWRNARPSALNFR